MGSFNDFLPRKGLPMLLVVNRGGRRRSAREASDFQHILDHMFAPISGGHVVKGSFGRAE